MMKLAFYVMLKALFVFEIFTFLSKVFDYIEKHLDEKYVVNFKIYDVTDWTTNIITLHILPNISKNKGNHFLQTMKFG